MACVANKATDAGARGAQISAAIDGLLPCQVFLDRALLYKRSDNPPFYLAIRSYSVSLFLRLPDICMYTIYNIVLVSNLIFPRFTKASYLPGCKMISSGRSGSCSTCGHFNEVHRSEPCAARRCRRKIKVCGSTVHTLIHMDGTVDENWTGWVVCRPCPEHGRESKDVDYSSCPVIAKDDEGNLVIVQYGVEY